MVVVKKGLVCLAFWLLMMIMCFIIIHQCKLCLLFSSNSSFLLLLLSAQPKEAHARGQKGQLSRRPAKQSQTQTDQKVSNTMRNLFSFQLLCNFSKQDFSLGFFAHFFLGQKVLPDDDFEKDPKFNKFIKMGIFSRFLDTVIFF